MGRGADCREGGREGGGGPANTAAESAGYRSQKAKLKPGEEKGRQSCGIQNRLTSELVHHFLSF